MPSEEPPDYDNPFPLEVDDPELGQMIVWFCEARPLKAGLFLTPDGVTDMRGNYPLFAAAGRNAPCPCGSRDKFKKCCASKWRGWAERDRQRLRDEQIVATRRDGQRIFYSLTSTHVTAMIETLHGIYCVEH